MSTAKQRKLPCNYNIEVDKISNLPGHVINKILSKLPLRDAARTSILSRNWRYKFSSLPHLVFDKEIYETIAENNTFVNIVNHVLMLHDGPIEKLSLSHSYFLCVDDIDTWIFFLSRHSVKELVLNIRTRGRYKFPSSLYSLKNMVHLELGYCHLKPPVTFDGFKSLKSLVLEDISMEKNAFEYMISSCPLLERLTLNTLNHITNVVIHAPNLVSFDITGLFETINFRDTCLLSIVSIALWGSSSSGYNLNSGSSVNLINLFLDLPRIQRLSLKLNFLKSLASGKVPRKLPTPCLELRFLSLSINLNDTNECLAAHCILRSCPNLKELEIVSPPEDGGRVFEAYVDGVEDDNDNNCVFNHLIMVKVIGISGHKQEVNFIKYILANSPVLEKMMIKYLPVYGNRKSLIELMKELLLLNRRSVKSQIIFQER